MKLTYHGSCHCKAVTFEADVDLDDGTNKCNCTYCWKQRMWNAGNLQKDDFRITKGEEMLADYGRAGEWGEGHHRFCRHCGTGIYAHGHIEEMGGDFVTVRLSTLDDLPVDDLVSAPVRYFDGLHDNWWAEPDDKRHL